LRELRVADIPRKTELHAVRKSTNAAVRAVERVGDFADNHHREFGGGMDAVAEAGGDSSAAVSVPGLVVVGPGMCKIRLDAAGGSLSGMGVFRMAENAEKENHAEGKELVQPEGSDIPTGGGIRANSAVVVARRSALGQDARSAGAVSWIAVRGVMERDTDCSGGVVPEGGDAGFAAGTREGSDGSEPRNVDPISSADVTRLVADLSRALSSFGHDGCP